jgi:hypothetical protein
MKIGWILSLLLLLISGSAWSGEIYCRGSHTIHFYPGGEFHKTWDVVNSTVRKVQLPGRTKPTTGCSSDWNSVGGMYRPIEIIQAPKLGQARIVHTYRVFYKSAKNGQDALTIRLHWVDRHTGKLSSAVVHFDIHVTDQPL